MVRFDKADSVGSAGDASCQLSGSPVATFDFSKLKDAYGAVSSRQDAFHKYHSPKIINLACAGLGRLRQFTPGRHPGQAKREPGTAKKASGLIR
jgi:hypothetical protein